MSNDLILLQSIYNDLLHGNVESSYANRESIGSICITKIYTDDKDITEEDVQILDLLVRIGNITYNNTSYDILPIEDGVYDLLLEKYKKFNPNYQVGSTEVYFDEATSSNVEEVELVNPLNYMNDKVNKYYDNRLFDFVNKNKVLTQYDLLKNPLQYDITVSKRLRNTPHSHPELVGTLDKCKFVLNCQAEEAGVFNDPNVKVFERDFLGDHIQKGIIGYNDGTVLIAELKYDGVSVEADCTDHIICAHTRGDTAESNASDLTPIFKGYRFPNAKNISEPIGIKFEAIITYSNLELLNKLRGTSYINGRTAIIGLLGSSDAYKYRELITLVPLETTLKDEDGNRIDRLVEIEFMNKYYTRDQLLRFNVLSGSYVNLMYQVKRFVEEAEMARSILPFMYDGVVISYYDPNIRAYLGRVNSVNKYSIAIKFNALRKETIFRGYTYTVGKDGTITPMIHYDPVEFFGSIHTKSTGHSYARFNDLNLAIGDIIPVTYVNDVMPYVGDVVEHSGNAPEKFIEYCPSCGTKLVFPKSNAIAICPNMNCKDRCIKRLSDSLKFLNIKDFSEKSIEELMRHNSYAHLWQLFEAPEYSFGILGDGNKVKLRSQLDAIMSNPIKDYKIIGCLGFNNIAFKTWKLIFGEIYVTELSEENMNLDYLYDRLKSIKGIGDSTINTIISEYELFKDDIQYILTHFKIENTKDTINENSLQIRFTGFRDHELSEFLNSKGFDADDNSGVTKSTNYLLIPYSGYDQGNKIAKAKKYGVKIVTVEELLNELNIERG